MELRQTLLHLADTYQAARRLSRSRVSTVVFNDGKVLDRLANGSDITVGRLEEAFRWFSANWPDGAAWPESVPRPDPAVTGNQQEVFPS